MYLTPQSFYQQYLSSLPTSELFFLFQLLDQLLQTYGVYKLKTASFHQLIKKVSPALFLLLSLLIYHKKFTKPFIKSLKHFIFTHTNPTECHFTITSPSKKVNIQLEKKLKKQFKKSDFSLLSSPKMSLIVQGGKFSYERSLEKDLKKLFEQ
ncbi:MAG: hypothetical protein LBG59_00910 [Candidatus Peribacteria bacterium]|jgi:hypothetical protein|nr:hypothetical protein [Candidatus Peribacteria bacterium]